MSVAEATLQLADVRPRAAAALAPETDTDPSVLADYADSASPPALLLLWDDPWLQPEPAAFGPCLHWQARLEVLAIASRVEPGPGIEKLEELVSYVVGRMVADDFSWPVASVIAPGRYEIGGVPYLGARVVYSLRVTV